VNEVALAEIASGMSVYGYRCYKLETGRLLNRHPVGESGELNLYAFGPNSPLSGFDPTGRDWLDHVWGWWPGDDVKYNGDGDWYVPPLPKDPNRIRPSGGDPDDLYYDGFPEMATMLCPHTQDTKHFEEGRQQGQLLKDVTLPDKYDLAGGVLGKFGDLRKLGKACKGKKAKKSVRLCGAGRKVASSLDEFLIGRHFDSQAEARKAYEAYKNAAKADKGILIGHGDDALRQAFNGWQTFRIKESQWTIGINMAWIDGAVDAGKPVRLVTPFNQVRRGSVTWGEIQRTLLRGGELIAP